MHAEKTVAKRERVLAAAEAVFLSQGYARTTMGHLAAAVGMSRPALYLIHPRKHEVFSAILQEESRCDSLNRSRKDDIEGLRNWMMWVCDLWLGDAAPEGQPADTVRIHPQQRSESSPREMAFLQSILKEGLSKRSPWPVDDAVCTSVARLLTFCVCGLLDARVGAVERRALLAVQIDALADAALRPEEPEARFHRRSTRTPVGLPTTERDAAAS